MSREIDALVAEKVMGYSVSEDRLFCRVYGSPDHLVCTSKDKVWRRILPRYSTDISDAWEVVEELYRKGYVVNIRNEVKAWVVIFEQAHGQFIISEEKVTLAICKAALKSVGVEV